VGGRDGGCGEGADDAPGGGGFWPAPGGEYRVSGEGADVVGGGAAFAAANAVTAPIALPIASRRASWSATRGASAASETRDAANSRKSAVFGFGDASSRPIASCIVRSPCK
jgi:hypothetical protein